MWKTSTSFRYFLKKGKHVVLRNPRLCCARWYILLYCRVGRNNPRNCFIVESQSVEVIWRLFLLLFRGIFGLSCSMPWLAWFPPFQILYNLEFGTRQGMAKRTFLDGDYNLRFLSYSTARAIEAEEPSFLKKLERHNIREFLSVKDMFNRHRRKTTNIPRYGMAAFPILLCYGVVCEKHNTGMS